MQQLNYCMGKGKEILFCLLFFVYSYQSVTMLWWQIDAIYVIIYLDSAKSTSLY